MSELLAAAYGDSKFAAGGQPSGSGIYNVTVLTAPATPTHYNWTPQTEDFGGGSGDYITSMIFADGIFAAVGGNFSISALLQTSPDGVTWTLQTTGFTALISQIYYDGSTFFAVGYNGGASPAHLEYSTNGASWSAWTSNIWPSAYGYLTGIAYSGSIYVATLQHRFITTTSNPTSASWTNTGAGAFSIADSFLAVSYGNSLFICIGMTSGGLPELQTSGNGTSWTLRTPPTTGNNTNASFKCVYCAPSLFLIGGADNSGYQAIFTSANGTSWTQATLPASLQSISGQFAGITFNGSLYMAVSTNGNVATSPDGATWTDVTPLSSSYNQTQFFML